MPQEATTTSVGTLLADWYAASTFEEGVLKGRQEATVVLLELGVERPQEVTLGLIAEFSRRLRGRPFPPFRHGDAG